MTKLAVVTIVLRIHEGTEKELQTEGQIENELQSWVDFLGGEVISIHAEVHEAKKQD